MADSRADHLYRAASVFERALGGVDTQAMEVAKGSFAGHRLEATSEVARAHADVGRHLVEVKTTARG